MSVLIFIDQSEGHVKKSSLEAMSYGAKIAEQLNTTAEGIVLGSSAEDLTDLGKYGVKKIHHVSNESLNSFRCTGLHQSNCTGSGSNWCYRSLYFQIMWMAKPLHPRLSARLKAGLVSGAVALPETSNGFTVKKNVFSGKAFANISVDTPIKIISLNPNAYKIQKAKGKRK